MSDFDRKLSEDIAVIKNMVVTMERHLKELNGNVKDNRVRIGRLEGWRLFITGGMAMVGLMVPVVLILIEVFFRQ